MATLQFNSEKIQFNDEIDKQNSLIIIIGSIVLLSVIYLISTNMCALNIIICATSVMCMVILLRNQYLKDYSREIPLSDISYLKIIFRRNGNIILKTYRKKGKYRLFTSIKNREDANHLIDFAKSKQLKVKIVDYVR